MVDEIHSAGGTAAAFSLDVTDYREASSVVVEVIRKGEAIDLLVNNAGVITYHTPVWETTMEQWDEVMNTNLRGMHQVCHAVTPHMISRGQGTIIKNWCVLERAMGFEPTTFCLGSKHSTTELRPPAPRHDYNRNPGTVGSEPNVATTFRLWGHFHSPV